MLSKLKQLTTLKNNHFQEFNDINQSKNQLQENIDNLNEKINASKINYDLLVTIEKELTLKINEVKDFKKNNNLQDLQIKFTNSLNDFNELNEKILKVEENCFHKSNELQKLLKSFF